MARNQIWLPLPIRVKASQSLGLGWLLHRDGHCLAEGLGFVLILAELLVELGY